MKNYAIILATLLSLLIPMKSWGADLNTGVDAYMSGDYATALNELKPLAKKGNAAAQTNLGIMYKEGKGVPQSNKTSVKWFTAAAEQGHAKAQYNLGYMYEFGQGITQDLKAARLWYGRAALQNYPRALYAYAVMLETGKGGAPKDEITAYIFYEFAAILGHPIAQFNTANFYDKGKVIPQDYKTAFKLFILSAEQGFAKAQYNLGIYYGLGQGVTKNYELAYMWSSIAFLNGVKLAKQNIDFLAKKLTPSQIEKVKTLTLECIEKGYKGC